MNEGVVAEDRSAQSHRRIGPGILRLGEYVVAGRRG